MKPRILFDFICGRCWLLLVISLSLTGQAIAQCERYATQAAESRKEQDDRSEQYRQAVKELKMGMFCSTCRRTKTELERSGTNFEKHIAEGASSGRRAVPASQQDYDKLYATYTADFNRLKQRIEDNNQRYQDCQTEAQKRAWDQQLEQQRQQQQAQHQQLQQEQERQQQEADRQREQEQQRQQELENQRQQLLLQQAQQRQQALQDAAITHQQNLEESRNVIDQVTSAFKSMSDQLQNKPNQGDNFTNRSERNSAIHTIENSSLEDLSNQGNDGFLEVMTFGTQLLGEGNPVKQLWNKIRFMDKSVDAWHNFQEGDLAGFVSTVPLPRTVFAMRPAWAPSLKSIQEIGTKTIDLYDHSMQSFLNDGNVEEVEQRFETYQREVNESLLRSIPTVGTLYGKYQKLTGSDWWKTATENRFVRRTKDFGYWLWTGGPFGGKTLQEN